MVQSMETPGHHPQSAEGPRMLPCAGIRTWSSHAAPQDSTHHHVNSAYCPVSACGTFTISDHPQFPAGVRFGHGRQAAWAWDANAWVSQHQPRCVPVCRNMPVRPACQAISLPGFTALDMQTPIAVPDIIGEPDCVATAVNSAGQLQLLFVADWKTVFSFPVGSNTTTAEAWQEAEAKPSESIRSGVGQVFGYMCQNSLDYRLLKTGELFVFMQTALSCSWQMSAAPAPIPLPWLQLNS